MNLKRYLPKSRIIDLRSPTFEGAVAELIASVPENIIPSKNRTAIAKDLIEREKSISTADNGICIPHTRVKGLKHRYVFAVGRCPEGLEYNGSDDYKNARILFILLSNDGVNSYLGVLNQLMRIYSKLVSEKIANIKDFSSFRDEVFKALDESVKDAPVKELDKSERLSLAKVNKMNIFMAKSAAKILKTLQCSSIMFLTESIETAEEVAPYFGDAKVVLVVEKQVVNVPKNPNWSVINVRSFSKARFSHLGSAIMIGFARGIFSAKDKICCIGGVREGKLIDALAVIDVEREFPNIFITHKEVLPSGVKPEVVERVIDIATELSVEGREGKPVGCLFVIGDREKLEPHLKQLILNPFHGYKPEDRNVLNPFMDETVKEYSLIDGAFVISGEGILEAAGALIHTPDFKLQLPGGLGSRHAAAYAVSLMVDCVAIVVSSSTGQVTLFRRGQTMPLTDKRKM